MSPSNSGSITGGRSLVVGLIVDEGAHSRRRRRLRLQCSCWLWDDADVSYLSP
jgi:hypothetical protein